MVHSVNICGRVVHQLNLFLAAVAFTLVFIPVLLLFCLPIYLFRFLLSHSRKLLRPDLGKILCVRSTVCSIDDIYTFPKCTLLSVSTVEGDVEVENIRAHMQNIVITAKDKKSGKLIYPEFQQFYETWCGFSFWKWDKNFKIEDHVRVYEKSMTTEMNDLDVGLLRMELVRSPYRKEKSPWEIVIVKNYRPSPRTVSFEENDFDNNKIEVLNCESKKSVIIFRIHHGIADGYSLLNLFVNHICSKNLNREKLVKPRYVTRNLCQTIFHFLKMALVIPYYVVRQRLECRDDNEFHPPEEKLTRRYFTAAERIPTSVIKGIKNNHGVTFTPVLHAAVTGGLRNFLLNNEMTIPKKFHIVTALPWPGHPQKLRNYWTFCVVKLPLEIADSRERLRVLHKNWEAIRKSTVPAMNFALVPLVGAMPLSIIKYFARTRFTSMIVSNFPGPSEKGNFFGYPLLDASFGGGLGRGTLGCGMAIMSLHGVLQINMGIDQGILPSQEKVQELMNHIRNEIGILGQGVFV